MINIEKEKMNDVFIKYHLKGLPFDAVLHHFSEQDKNEHIHDHPWSFTSHVLKGSYVEKIYTLKDNVLTSRDVLRKEGSSHFVNAELIHEIIDLPEGECYTLIRPDITTQRDVHFWKFEDGKVFNRKWDEIDFKEINPHNL